MSTRRPGVDTFAGDGAEATGAVVATFDRAAARYRDHAQVQREMAAWLAEWLPEIRRGRALEIGAGSGLFTERLVPWHGAVVATDLSPAMCAAGRENVPGVTWAVMPAEAPEGRGWEWIFSSSMLQWAGNPAAMLAGWRDRLAPGGRILAGLYVAETLPEVRAVTGRDGPVCWRTSDAWRGAIGAAGLSLRRDDVDRRVFHHASALALWRSLHAVGGAPTARTSPGRLRDWVREYDRRFRTPAGVPATWTFYRFEAERG